MNKKVFLAAALALGLTTSGASFAFAHGGHDHGTETTTKAPALKTAKTEKEALAIEPTAQDKCAWCEMVIYTKDQPNGKWMVKIWTADNKITWADDSGCAFNYARVQKKAPKKMWVRDYNTSKWIDIKKAFVVTATEKTPMNYGYSFFETKAAADKFVKANAAKLKAKLVTWKQVDADAKVRYDKYIERLEQQKKDKEAKDKAEGDKNGSGSSDHGHH